MPFNCCLREVVQIQSTNAWETNFFEFFCSPNLTVSGKTHVFAGFQGNSYSKAQAQRCQSRLLERSLSISGRTYWFAL